ncbi:endolytic transglycosylase MltG [Ectothiorhodospiraceae bacterium BW-2]|nr:endolytic transglycosylase MltG [Ectothiorhodospiraceae bacterium BW-2]
MTRLLYRLLGASLLLGSLLAGWIGMGFNHFSESLLNVDGLVVTLERGDNLRDLSQKLYQQGVISHSDYFYYLGRWHGYGAKLRAGEFKLSGELTPKQLLQQLVSLPPRHYSFTLVEGWNIEQLQRAVAADSKLQHQLEERLAPTELMARLGLEGHPEGQFMPDTYHYTRASTDIELLQRAYRAMQTFLQQQWPERQPELALKTPYEAQIMASIVEKETGLASERADIAGVFVRRLKRNMRLQTDPTVIYGLGEAFDGNLTRAQLRQDTPYNSYTRHGLPPTPIAMPGREAIVAALHPAKGSSLYFVARGDGSHQFSATLKEHNAAVKTYQLR